MAGRLRNPGRHNACCGAICRTVLRHVGVYSDRHPLVTLRAAATAFAGAAGRPRGWHVRAGFAGGCRAPQSTNPNAAHGSRTATT